jgi:ABC-2 type transport system permease protein
MRLALAFFKRDAIIALSYRFSFVVQLLGNLLVLAVAYYVGKTVETAPSPALKPYGGSFLAFLLVGIALGDCATVSLTTFAHDLRESQLTGTLEATLMSPLRLHTILIFSSFWSYFFSGVRFLFYLLLGSVFYGVSMSHANLPAALIVFILTVLCFMAIGIIWAAIVMIVKRGEAIITTVGYLVVLVSGVIFPSTLLPAWLRAVSSLVPLTPALEGMRLAILKGAGLGDLKDIVLRLILFAIFLFTIGLTAFNWAVETAKRTGSLTEY